MTTTAMPRVADEGMAGASAGAGAGPPLGNAEFAAIAAIMQSDARIHLTDIKKTLVHGRLARRLRMHGLATFPEYLRMVKSDPEERAAMVVALTTNHTHFFRENHHFDHLRTVVLPQLKEQARQRPVRIWSAGCSSGEEVYSIAMTLLGQDRAGSQWLRDRDVRLLATDLSPPVVQAVRAATYADTIVAAIPDAYRRLWVRPAGTAFEIAPEARDLVTAQVLNLFGAWPMRRQYDVIFCRNVMIYFDERAKAELEQRLIEMLIPGGHLYIGHSERLVGPAARGDAELWPDHVREAGDDVMGPVRTLIVDDSASIRAVLRRILTADPDIEVIGEAPETATARTMIKELEPDVITLDVEMPGMDGISFLEKIMRLRPMPVVMCSTLTARGAAITIEALRLGAVDCIAKPSAHAGDLERDAALLRRTVKAAARSSVRAAASPPRTSGNVAYRFKPDALIAVGSSTGGVEALFSLLPALPADAPPVLVVQHMPGAFTRSFAERLDRECRMTVVEARDGCPVTPGTVYIAPGGDNHMEFAGGSGGSNGCIRLRPGALASGHRPSVDTLFHSVAARRPGAVGVILTGMGADGADGLLAMRQGGARTFGQSQESCVIYGMPRAAFERGGVERQLGLAALPEAILTACNQTKSGA